MVKALADRLAEAFAEYLHAQARDDWGYPDAREPISDEDLHREKHRGIRPALRLSGVSRITARSSSCSTAATPNARGSR